MLGSSLRSHISLSGTKLSTFKIGASQFVVVRKSRLRGGLRTVSFRARIVETEDHVSVRKSCLARGFSITARYGDRIKNGSLKNVMSCDLFILVT